MIGLVTCAAYPDLTDDDRPLIAALRRLGLDAAPVIWDDPTVAWERHSMLLLRSTWNYHRKAGAFVAWLDHLDAIGVPLLNATPVVRWNMHKRYLRALGERGVRVPRTEWVARADARPLATIRRGLDAADVVIKPAVSASATDTWRARAGSLEEEHRYRQLVDRTDVLVQPIIPEVSERGEWSLMYVDGAYSHAMLKRPRAGDFRVQAEHGGTAVRAAPADALRAEADRIVSLIPGDWGYARVDGVVTDAGFLLMELECIEPALFLAEQPGAAERLAGAVERRLCGR